MEFLSKNKNVFLSKEHLIWKEEDTMFFTKGSITLCIYEELEIYYEPEDERIFLGKLPNLEQWEVLKELLNLS